MADILHRAQILARQLKGLAHGRPGDALVDLKVAEVEEAVEVLEQLARLAQGKRPRKAQGMTSRSKRNRRPNTPYLAMVRRHVCIGCDDPRCPGIEAHHAGRKRDKGFGRKPPDDRTVPLGNPCHAFFHQHGHFKGLSPAETREKVEAKIVELQAEWAELQDAEGF